VKALVFLFLAVVAEVCATTALKLSDGFTRLGPAALVVVGYVVAFYLLSLSLREIDLGTAYAIWAGLGTAGVVAIGAIAFREVIDPVRLIAIAMIIAGVVLLNVHDAEAEEAPIASRFHDPTE
jgi:small multidrug resistance pump